MKKLLSILAIALFVNLTVAQAQTSTATAPAAIDQKEAVAKDAMPQCHGVTAACPKSCMDEKAKGSSSTTTLSENYANAGSTPEADKKDMKATCAGDHSKSCCKSSSRASSMTKELKPAKTSTAIAPKETETPK
ncbi:MAG: hypothetical protein IPO83_05490 [Chitinophagaceae bacterium]|nr:hypothetical protein [Chitinophagaceae bacterium]